VKSIFGICSRKQRKAIKTYVEHGIPLQIFKFVYNTNFNVLEDLISVDALEEFLETSTSFSHICFIVHESGDLYMKNTDEQISQWYIKFIQDSNNHFADISCKDKRSY